VDASARIRFSDRGISEARPQARRRDLYGREQAVTAMGSPHEKRLLFILNHPVQDGSARYRIYQFLPYLEAAGYRCTVRPFSNASLFGAIRGQRRWFRKAALTAYCTARRFGDLNQVASYDLIVIHREAFPFLMPWMEERILNRNSKVIFSFDDAIYAGHTDRSVLNHPWLYKWKYGSGVDNVLRRSRAVIAGNSTLAEYALKFNSNVHIVPTVIDLENYQAVVPRVFPPRIRIGWFGSNTTSPYLGIALPALKRIAEKYGNEVEFRFFGDPSLSLGLANAKYFPFCLSTEVDDLRTIDVGLMPMPDNEWTRGKCSFKAIQYMALGAPAVASPVGMASDVVRHGVTGFLADNEEDWFNALELLITDTKARDEMSVAARRSVACNYSIQVWGDRFRQILDSELGVDRGIEVEGAVHS
jgi:glycosyltransferase involved in cell wall biosynthesis